MPFHAPSMIDRLIAQAPRQPSSRLFMATRQKGNEPVSTPGEILDQLNVRGLDAVRNLVVTESAETWLRKKGIPDRDGLGRLLQRSSPDLIRHLNTIPEGFRLTVIAARPASQQEAAEQTGIYETHRAKYIRLIAGLAQRHPDHFSSVRIRELTRAKANGKPPAVLTMGGDEIARMRTGTLPAGWSVEHRNDRGLAIEGERHKNRVGNLMIMPETHNEWEARLKALQYVLAFKAGRDSKPTLIFQAEAINGPAQGYFVFGAHVPATVKLSKLSRMLETGIGDLQPDGIPPARNHAASARAVVQSAPSKVRYVS